MRSVIIIGAGPAGLTAARVLRQGGLADVLVIERNEEAGGLPRFCDHPGWGMLDLRRFYTGPTYARRLVERAAGVEIRTGTGVIEVGPEGKVVVAGAGGIETLQAEQVLLATGIRETPRSARLVSGTRPWGVFNTGAFQAMVQAGIKPCELPILVGSELVSFSALVTARHGGIRPVAMIEENDRILARRPGDLIARAVFGVPVWTRTRLLEIRGGQRVEAVVVEREGAEQIVPCDGVLFTGRFLPEVALLRGGPVALEPHSGGPAVDSHFRCGDSRIFAAGNVLRPVEHSGYVALEGARAAAAILAARRGELPPVASGVTVEIAGALAWAIPRRVYAQERTVTITARLSRAFRGSLLATLDGKPVHRQSLRGLPERRLSIRLPGAMLRGGSKLLLSTIDGG